MRHFIHSIAGAAMLAAASLTTANAHEPEHHTPAAVAGDLEISSPWARAMLPGQRAGGGYVSIANRGGEADRLVGGTSPAAGRVEIHTMEVVDDVMTMRPVAGGLEIPAGETVELAPGGLHLMFMEVAEPFAEGEAVPVTLEFEKAGAVEASFQVRGRQDAGDDGCPSEHGGH